MSGIAFIHCQTFSRKPNPAGQCVRQVIAEGLRSGGYHAHVAQPLPPIVLFGDPRGFEALHAAHVAQRRTRARHGGRLRDRAIRRDRHTLCTIVASWPVATATALATPRERARLRRWARRTLAWVRACHGDQVKAAFAHLDEAWPHLHIWLLPDAPDADATRLHPGKQAKRAEEARLKALGVAPREAVRAGNRALRAAMRDWLDAHHRAVGAPLGLRRDGPKRRRLSRAQLRAEQAMLDHHRRLDEDLIARKAQIERLAATRDALVAQLGSAEGALAGLLREAERTGARLKAEADALAATGPMLDALAREIVAGTLRIGPDDVWHVQDPAPFRAAGRVTRRLTPAVRHLLDRIAAAEDGRPGETPPGPAGPAPGTPSP